jgi:hypothetical protein
MSKKWEMRRGNDADLEVPPPSEGDSRSLVSIEDLDHQKRL